METIHEEDTVIMAGDLSWAMNMDDAIADLKMLGRLPGRKIVVRGNHDYWWDTVTKMTRMTDGMLEFLHNSTIETGGVALAGTRGWISETSPSSQKRTNPSLPEKKAAWSGPLCWRKRPEPPHYGGAPLSPLTRQEIHPT